MDLEFLTRPAESRLDIGHITGTEGDYVTLRLFPIEQRARIAQAKVQGVKVSNIVEVMAENPDVNFQDSAQTADLLRRKPGIVGKIMEANPNFDGGFGYMLAALEFGVDPKKSSLVEGEKGAKLDRKTWERILRGVEGERLARFVVAEVEKFQERYTLGN